MPKSIHVETSGGLGNQLFAYFFALRLRSLVHKNVSLDLLHADRSVHHDKISLLDIELDNAIQICNTRTRHSKYKQLRSKLLASRSLLITRDTNQLDFVSLIDEENIRVIQGDFGSFFYFDGLPVSKKRLVLERKSDELVRFLQGSSGFETQSIHHRLGDFVNIQDSVGLLGRKYYQSAMQSSGEYEKCFIFSNDPIYSEHLFRSWNIYHHNMIWIQKNQFSNPAENLFAMSNSSSIICANSTFSFWGARLSENSTVFFPAQYRRDNLGSIRDLPKHWKPIEPDWASLGNLL
jgi:hypothetical protein